MFAFCKFLRNVFRVVLIQSFIGNSATVVIPKQWQFRARVSSVSQFIQPLIIPLFFVAEFIPLLLATGLCMNSSGFYTLFFRFIT